MSDYYRMSLLDTTGSWWDGDAAPMTDVEIDQVDQLAKQMTNLTYLALGIDGVTHYFNPANVVAIKLGVAAGPPPGKEAT